jgi:hypothetical protein
MASIYDGINCKANGCNAAAKARGFCNPHYQKWLAYGDPLIGGKRGPNGSGRIRRDGYKTFSIKYEQKLEHVIVAEKALGHSLPEKAIVHHHDEKRANNDPQNLVICPDQKYHMLLHRRMRALDACGHADWVRCRYCKTWDCPNNLYTPPGKNCGYHRDCRRQHRKH